MKKLLLVLIVSLSVHSVFADAITSVELGHHNYIDDNNNRMVHGVLAGVASSAIFGNFLLGLFVDGVYSVTDPGFILCKPGIEAGFMIWYPDLFYTINARGGPVFHDDKYVENKLDLAFGAKFSNYSRISDRNLFFIFSFAMDWYVAKQNLAYTITLGLGREAYFGSPSALAPKAAAEVTYSE
jgi:hypothetical protein